MTKETTSDDKMHQMALLLPWYAEGTLSEEERRKVEAHMNDCLACREELEDIQKIRGRVTTYYSERPGPSPQIFEKVKARIQQAQATQPVKEEASPKLWTRWLSLLESWTRPLFVPQWAASVAVALIVGQATLLVFVSLSPQHEKLPGSMTGPVFERGIPPAPSVQERPTSKIQLTFRENTSELQFREIIQELDGRIIDGPTKDGAYVVEIPSGNSSEIDRQLEALRTTSQVVRKAEHVN